jgi:acetyl-CoA carboxylase/biotin carboxylase 1
MQANASIKFFFLLCRFPAEDVLEHIDNQAVALIDASERSTFTALTSPLREVVLSYTQSKASGVPGAEKALKCFIDILRRWISVERCFYDGPSYADSVTNVRKVHKEDSATVLSICRAHEQLDTTSYIIKKIISIIGDGNRVDLATSSSSPIAKRVSIVAGAAGLPDAFPAISEVSMLGRNRAYAEVALRARKVLMQESMPSLEQRKQKVLEAAKKLVESDTTQAEDLLADQTPFMDVFLPLLKTVLTSKEEVGLVELYAKFLYRTYTLKNTEKNFDERLVKLTFTNKASERVLHKMTSVSSMADLSSLLSSSSLSKLGDSADNDADKKLLTAENLEKIPPYVQRTGICKIIESIDDLSDSTKVESILKNFPIVDSSVGPINVLYLILPKVATESDEDSIDALARRCQSTIASHKGLLENALVRRVSFLFENKRENGREDPAAGALTYRYPDYKEESMIRGISPSHATHLEMHRVAANFRVSTLAAEQTTTSHTHLYECTPRQSALAKDKRASKSSRMFVRALSFNLDFSSSSYERILVDALNALDLTSQSLTDNHLFVNLVSDFEKVVLDPVVVEQVVVDILKRHGDRVSALGIVEVETKILCSLSADSPPLSLRLVASNPTGYVHVMNTYIESADESGSDRVFKLIGGTKASLACAGDSSWEGLNVNTPYPLTRPFENQRKAALRSSDTLYCYDLPALFEAAIEKEWNEVSNEGGVEGSIRAAARPLMVMYTTELVVKKTTSQDPDKWTMEDYLNGDLELVEVSRRAGANNVGMVAWLMVLKTVEYPQVSRFFSIATWF